MIVLATGYLLLLIILLNENRKYPAGIFILANAYTLFLTLPAAVAYYVNFKVGDKLEYGDFDLDADIYLAVFYFQIISVLFSLWLYKIGFKQRQIKPVKRFFSVDNTTASYRWMTILLLVISSLTLLYVHSAFNFEYILEPRRLYELSRESFGIHFFALGLTLRLAALLVLLSPFRRKKLIFLALLVFTAITGAKINTYILLMFAAVYFIIYRKNGRISTSLLVKMLVGAIPFTYVLVAITFQGVEANIIDLLIGYVNEPWNNFVLLAQSFDSHFDQFFHGAMTLENNLISRIPRPLFPDKPHLFGGFRLGNAYFPEVVDLGFGAPSFGAEGIVYADWGVAGLGLLMLFNGACSYILGNITSILIRTSSSRRFGFIYFGLLLIFSNFYFFTLPPSNNLVDNVLIVFGLALVFKIQVRSMKRASYQHMAGI